MFSQRIIGRFSQRASQQMRSGSVRSTVQRRANSTEAKPSWAADNDFNRERAAVKHHAASTSGQSYPIESIDIFRFDHSLTVNIQTSGASCLSSAYLMRMSP